MTADSNLNIREDVVRLVTLSPQGNLDIFSAQKFREQVKKVIENGARYLVLDLSQTPFLDSAGMAVLVSALKECRQRGGDVCMVWPQAEPVKRILALTKFDRVFAMRSSVEEALASFRPSISI